MAYDEQLAARVRATIGPDHDEIRMFGGLAFMVNTHRAVGLTGGDLMLRTGPGLHEDAFARGAVPMEMGTRVVSSMVRVRGELVDTDDELEAWVRPAVADALAREPKPPKPAKPSRPRRTRGR